MEKTKRKVLVILTNRFSPSQAAKYLELDCESDGTILSEKTIRRQPREAIYDEVWENNEGKQELSSCNRMSKKYNHPLAKKK